MQIQQRTKSYQRSQNLAEKSVLPPGEYTVTLQLLNMYYNEFLDQIQEPWIWIMNQLTTKI